MTPLRSSPLSELLSTSTLRQSLSTPPSHAPGLLPSSTSTSSSQALCLHLEQFYALSLRHHPDRNRSDPSASQRFSRISAAYNVLSNAQKRATYDRDNGLHATPSHSHSSASPGHTHAHPMGSHSSGSYAGSRPASGLSKRRNAFHGPPPSFYEQGGYGSTGRRAETYAPGKAGAGAKAGGGFASAAGFDSSVDAEDWAGFINRNPLHHFNARGHFRTQAAEDQRRQERRRRQVRAAIREHAEHESRSGGGSRADDTVVRFLVVSGILVVATGITGLFKWSAATATAADAAHGGKATRRREAYS
ncbi:hypothetical protein PENANT_c010G05731 [Penicillium antarcticum]|uniref:J domain-containing protein n=1 Tax=Penicillium antarcticum TaxID=416450 RepID=A0A1V6Q8S6_9EURO|nr:hypothetical protein PENANT_c010G05731 [Penicillium antarcticum]